MRRELRFKTFDDALAELQRLEQGPVITLGDWSFYQILDHCAGSIQNSMNPNARPLPSLKKRVVGFIAKHVIFCKGCLPAGIQNPKAPSQRVEGDAQVAAKKLRDAITAFKDYSGPLAPHPFFGSLTKAEWQRILIFHLANHLGFVRSKK